MHACYRSYVHTSTWYLTQLELDDINLQLLDIGITELSRQTTTVKKLEDDRWSKAPRLLAKMSGGH